MSLGALPAVSAEPPTLTIDAGGHTAVITTMLVLPDDQLLSGSFDNTVRLWDLKRGETLRVLRGQVGTGRRGQVNVLAMTPDRRTLLVGGWFDDKDEGQHPIRVYNWPKGTLRGLLPGHRRPVRSMAVSPDGQTLVSGDYGGTLNYWRLGTKGFELHSHIQAHSERLSNLAFDPNGNGLLISTGYDGVARFWQADAQGLRELSAIRPLLVPMLYGLSYRRDGQVIAIGGAVANYQEKTALGEVRFYDRQGRQVAEPWIFQESGVTSVAFSPDGSRVAVGFGFPGTDTRAAVFSYPDRRKISEFTTHDNTVNVVRWLNDGRTIASVGSYDNAVHRWDGETGRAAPALGGRSRFIWNVGTSHDGQTLYWGSSVFDPKGRFGIEKYNQRGPLEFGLRLGAGGPELVSLGSSPTHRGTHQHQGKSLELFQDQRQQWVQLSGTGPALKSGRDRDVIYGATFLPFTAGTKLGADTPVLVAGGESLGLWDASSGRRIHELFGHIGQVLSVSPSPLGDFAVTGGGDQTIRLWHLPSGQLRLSIFQAGADWVAWTPKGYYAASPQGDRLIGWQINRGEGQDPEHYAAVQFSKKLLRPDVVRAVLEGENPPDPDLGIDVIEQLLPPQISIVEPTPPEGDAVLPVMQDQLEIRAVARSQGDHPVTELRLLIDGRPYDGKLGIQPIARPRKGSVTGTWKVALSQGTHRLAVQAKTAVSSAVSPGVSIQYADPTNPQGLPNLYVLAVGVAEYPADLRLNYAALDAELLARTLQSKASPLRKVTTQVVVNQQATRRGILSGMQWLKKEMKQQDLGIIFFSGHGMLDDSENFYLLPVDGETEDLLSTAVPGTLFRDFLADVPGQVVALLDACHSGAAGSALKTSARSTDNLVRSLINEDCGVVVMSSSRGQESSLESNQFRQGFFTMALTQGLAGQADRDGDSVVDLQELEGYVESEVKRLTAGRQNPVTTWPTQRVYPPLTSLAASRTAAGPARRTIFASQSALAPFRLSASGR